MASKTGYYEKNRNRILAQQKRYRQKNREFVRETVLCSVYKLTRGQVSQMMLDQDGRCPICDRVLKKFDVDHCHGTGKVRGLLCHRCNVALGYLEDSTTLLRRALRYLERNS